MPIRVPGVDLAWVTMNGLPRDATESTLAGDTQTAWAKVQAWLRLQRPGLRIAVTNPAFATLLHRFSWMEPRLALSVVYVPTTTNATAKSPA